MAIWPVTLPTLTSGFLAGTYKEAPPNNTIRTNMDIGPPKMRRRTTCGPVPISGQMLMTSTQIDILDTFYVSTLKYGSTSFGGHHPRLGSTVTMRFVDRPEWTDNAPFWNVGLSLEIIST